MPQNDSDLLFGQELIKEFGFCFPYTQQILRDPAQGNENQEIDPLHKLQSVVRTYDMDAALAQISAYISTVPGTQNINLPDTLTGINLYWGGSAGDGETTLQPQSFSVGGAIVTKVAGSAQASASMDGDVLPLRKAGYSGPAKTTLYTFFRPTDTIDETLITTVTGAAYWPVVRPKEINVVIFGYQESVRAGGKIAYSYGPNLVGIAAEIEESSTDRTNGVAIKAITIPPSLHGEIEINVVGAGPGTATATVASSFGGLTFTATATPGGTYAAVGLEATSPAVFPTGDYIYDVSVSPFLFGYSIIRATVVHITADMV